MDLRLYIKQWHVATIMFLGKMVIQQYSSSSDSLIPSLELAASYNGKWPQELCQKLARKAGQMKQRLIPPCWCWLGETNAVLTEIPKLILGKI